MHKPLLLSLSAQGEIINAQGDILTPPLGWSFLKAGDAGLTRRVCAMGPSWRVQVKQGKRVVSKGVWAPQENIAACQSQLQQERATDEYQKKLTQQRAYREKQQQIYVEDFEQAVLSYLNFHPSFASLALKMARAICLHATPVGSGTVARTARIPLEERAAKAVIAWMRHKTTGYDHMHIPLVKGERRKVRQDLAKQSNKLLQNYREGVSPAPYCPLQRALEE